MLNASLEDDAESVRATGAQGIPLSIYAALSGNLEFVRVLVRRGARDGTSSALHNAVSRGYYDIVRWLLDNGKPDSVGELSGLTSVSVPA